MVDCFLLVNNGTNGKREVIFISSNTDKVFDKEIYKKNFGRVISELRLEKRMSQEHLAFHSSLSTPFISEIERGIKYPTLLSILSIAEVLEVSPSQLLYLAEEKGRKK